MNFFKLDTREVFSLSVKLLPDVVLIEMKTLPYSGVSVTPTLVSKEPTSPLKTCTALVLAYNSLTFNL